MLLILLLVFLHYYTNFTGFIAYLFAIRFFQFSKISISTIIYLSILFLFLLFKSFDLMYFDLLVEIRFYFGFLIFLYFFNNKRNIVTTEPLNNLVFFLSIGIIIEKFLINFLITPTQLPNYSKEIIDFMETASQSTYNRPYSFGGSPTVSSCCLVILFTRTNLKGYKLFITLFAILLFSSSTGYMLLGIHLFTTLFKLENIKFLKKNIFFIISLIIVFILVIIPIAISRLTFDYFNEMFLYKLDLLMMFLKDNMNFVNLFFGITKANYNVDTRGGDFGFLSLFMTFGLVGTFFILAIILMKVNNNNIKSILLLLLASFHYPVMFFLPGQLLFGYLLSIKNE